MKKLAVLLLILAVVLALCACGASSGGSYSASLHTDQNAPDTQTAPEYSAKPEPDPTFRPTVRPAPEPTPEPAAGLTVPAVIPKALVYEGSGDSVIQIDHPAGVWVLYVKGNAESRFFAVKGYDSGGGPTELFVNTSDPYEGVTIDPDQETVTLEISANGRWHIEVRSVWTCPIVDRLTTFSGSGDSIVLLNVNASLAFVEANEADRYFYIRTYGDRTNLMVSTTEPYSGTVMMKYNPFLLEIGAVGAWSITLS